MAGEGESPGLDAESEASVIRSRLQAVMDNMTSILFIKDSHGRYVYVNKAYESLIHVRLDDIRDKTVFDLLPHDTASSLHAADREVFESGIPTQREELNHYESGTRAMLCVRFLLPSETGGPPHLCGIATDITDRRKAVEELRIAREELELRVQQRTAELASANESLKREADRTREQVQRLHLLAQVTKAIAGRHDLQSLYGTVLGFLRDGLLVDIAVVMHFDTDSALLVVGGRMDSPLGADAAPSLRPGSISLLGNNGLRDCVNGKTMYYPALSPSEAGLLGEVASGGFRSAAAAPLGDTGGIIGLVLVVRRESHAFSNGDCEFLTQLGEHVALAVTQLRLLDELHRAGEDLRETQTQMAQQERMRAMGQMASGIAHDINNALGPVTLNCEMLLETESLSEQGRESLQIILEATDGVAKTIAGLRQFYRGAEEMPIPVAVRLNDLVHQGVQLAKPRWKDIPQQNGASITLELLLDDFDPEFEGYETEVRNALTNLIFNAVDAMPKGGKLGIRTMLNAEFAMVEVSDTGVGMDERARLRCLEPFFTTKGDRGTGLGLPMVYGVMNRHHGTINIESEQGKGTKVTLSFPRRDIHPTPVPVAPPPIAPTRQLNLLCVDDDPDVRTALATLLRRDGHAVEVAEGGPAAISRCEVAGAFDAVITDLGMPGMDGRELARELRARWPRMPIILLTGWGSHLIQQARGVNDFAEVLSKPPRAAEIRAALAKACG